MRIKIALIFLASTILALVSTARESRQEFISARGSLEREQLYLRIVKHLDSKKFSAAESLFKTIPTGSGLYWEMIDRHFPHHEYDLARDACGIDIDIWIIDTAADWQVPALSTLLDNPDRLHFLQNLADYRQKFLATTAKGQKSEALVSDILEQAKKRKKDNSSLMPKKLPYVLIIHEVADYTAWKKVFDGAASIRNEAGERTFQVLRYASDANKIVHFSTWTSIADARAFFESPRLVKIREEAGVKAPEFIYLDELESGTL